MPIQPFSPPPMKLSILTAALQELTPRDRRDPDPDLAIEEWLEFARDIGSPNIQLSAALHPTLSDVPAEAMLDPVANTLDLRAPFDKNRAARVLQGDEGHGRRPFRPRLLRQHARRTIRPPANTSTTSCCACSMPPCCSAPTRCADSSAATSSSRWTRTSSCSSRSSFRLLKEAKARGLTYRVEQCPMPGWNMLDRWHNNIAYAPGPWIALHRICEKHGVGDQFRIHYDPSHAILMGQDTRSLFQYLKDEGYGFLIGGFHVKGQVVDSRGVSAWGYGGQTMQRGDWINGKPSPNPADAANAWKKQVVLAEHELPGTARHDPLAYLQNRTRRLARSPARRARAAVDRSGGHLSGRRARVPAGAHPGQGAARADPERLARVREGDRRSGGGDVRAQHEVMQAQGIQIQGVGREAYRS